MAITIICFRSPESDATQKGEARRCKGECREKCSDWQVQQGQDSRGKSKSHRERMAEVRGQQKVPEERIVVASAKSQK